MTEDLKEARLVSARVLMDKHGLHDWQIQIADLRRVPSHNLVGDISLGSTRGICRFFDRTILIDSSLIAHRNKFLGVVLHEIAHALAGPTAGHGKEWLRIAKKIGCSKRSLAVYRFQLQ